MVDQTANFIRGETDSSVGAGDTTISVVDATEFPDPANGEYNLTLWNGDGRPDQDSDAELVRVTGRDTGTNDLTVTRAQEGTSDVSHPTGSALQLGTSAKVIDDLAGQFTNIEVFTADGTFDATGIDTAYVECVGGGGGGGAFDGSTQTFGTSAGGGGGGYARAIKDISAETSISVTVGSGGSGGSGTSSGSAGGDSIFSTPTQVIGNGGGGGQPEPTGGGTSIGGSGGGGQGDVTIIGQNGASGDSISTSVSQDVFSLATSEGGDSIYGHGAEQETIINARLSGINGNAYGGGGGGAVSASGVTVPSLDGGNGASGIVIVRY